MVLRGLTPLFLGLSLLGVAHPAFAQKAGALPLVSEIRLGILAHDPLSPEGGAADIAAELLFSPLLKFGSRTRLHPSLGGSLNLAGKTSHGFAALSLNADVTNAIFLEGSLGLALHNGRAAPAPRERNAMDCALHFREAVSIGYRIDPNWSLMGTLEHLSNGGLCKTNRGLTNFGARIGYRF